VLNSEPTQDTSAQRDEMTEHVVAAGPRGALMLAGIATACVVAIWFGFYVFVFLLRGALQ
jgi:hypothetical protein